MAETQINYFTGRDEINIKTKKNPDFQIHRRGAKKG